MKSFRHLLLASVTLTGCAVLIIEILAIRMLSPYFGNTIYTTSSVIGIILAALSFGYYAGGKFSDRHSSLKIFYGIIAVSGILVIALELFNRQVLPSFSLLFSLTEGPIITSIAMFFVPAFCLGLLSPYAVALNKKADGGVGSAAGEVFFFSTLGSIAGSLGTGFFLIPMFGVSVIITTTGLTLFAWGLLGIWLASGLRPRLLLISVLIIILVGFISTIGMAEKAEGVIYQKDGVYEKITISDGVWNGKATRFLFQDRSYSAAKYLDSNELPYDYTKYYSLYQIVNPQASQALVIGGGAWSMPQSLLNSSPTIQVDVAEIEPHLFNLAKTYFGAQENSRLTNYTQDGRRLLTMANKHYDVIVSDVYYSLFSIPMHFTTQEFFQLAKEKLTNNGVFIGNFAGYIYGKQPSFILSEIKTFRQVFPNSYFFAVRGPNLTEGQNIIFLGIKGDTNLDFSSTAITNNSDEIIKSLSQKNIDITKLPLEDNIILTDNYAPVEYLVGGIVGQWHQ